MSDWFPSVVLCFEEVTAYVIERFSDVSVLVLSASIDTVINYPLHDEVLRGRFVFHCPFRFVFGLVQDLLFILFGLAIDGRLSGVRPRFFRFHAGLRSWRFNHVWFVCTLVDGVSKVVFGGREQSEDVVNHFDRLRFRCDDDPC